VQLISFFRISAFKENLVCALKTAFIGSKLANFSRLLVKEDEKKLNSVFAQSLALDERIVFLLRSQVEYYKIFIYSPFSLISY